MKRLLSDEELRDMLIALDDVPDPLPEFFAGLRNQLPQRPSGAARVSRGAWWHRAGVGAAVVGIAVVGVVILLRGLGGQSEPSSAACGLVLELRGATYYGQVVTDPFRAGRSVGAATFSACSDVGGGGGNGGGGKTVRVRAVVGANPNVEVALAHDPTNAVYLRAGFYPQTDLYPLRVPSQFHGCQRTGRFQITGRVVAVGPSYPFVDVDAVDAPSSLHIRSGDRVPLFVSDKSRFVGLNTYGVGHLSVGQNVTVVARGCLIHGARQPRVVPVSIRPSAGA